MHNRDGRTSKHRRHRLRSHQASIADLLPQQLRRHTSIPQARNAPRRRLVELTTHAHSTHTPTSRSNTHRLRRNAHIREKCERQSITAKKLYAFAKACSRSIQPPRLAMFTTKERTQTKLTRNVYAEQRVISLT